MDVNYPAANRELKEKILLSGGALVSELPPGTKPDGRYFPTRNRLLAGLGMGVLVTHAPTRSGSLITAELALEQGKEIFCLPPYNIYDASCTGVVPLLKEGAKPVYSVYSILEEYYPLYADRINLAALPGESSGAASQKWQTDLGIIIGNLLPRKQYRAVVQPPARLNAFQRQVYDVLTGDPRPVDEIIDEAGLRPDQALATLSELEMMGLAAAHPGRRYSRMP